MSLVREIYRHGDSLGPPSFDRCGDEQQQDIADRARHQCSHIAAIGDAQRIEKEASQKTHRPGSQSNLRRTLSPFTA
jgi:hypothetical protein